MTRTALPRLAGSILCLLVALVACPASAQRADPDAYAELLENFFLKNAAAAETDASTLLEFLASRLENPLDLNRATREDLAALHLLSGLQIENFLAYRARLGPFLSLHELQSVPGWEMDDLRRVLPLLRVGTESGRQAAASLLRMAVSGKNECVLRWARTPEAPDAQRFEGSRDWLAFRFRHAAGERLRYGFTLEKDPGETAFRGSNRRSTDFVSGHFFLQNFGKNVRALAIGDFSARFGQGLLLQQSFAPGKTAETIHIARGGARLSPYSAFGEIFFFRGIGTTVRLARKWEATAFFSSLKRDATPRQPLADPEDDPSENPFSTLQTSGLHRTTSEIAAEKSVREQAIGLSISRSDKHGRVAANFLHFDFDKAMQPGDDPRQQFQFSGKQLNGASLDYNFHRRNLLFFGETALSQNGRAATLNGLILAADRRVALALLHRHFDRAYQSIYASPFAETADAANERGLYLGVEIRPAKGWQLNGYADVWRHPWLRFGTNGPSTGQEFLGMLRFAPQKTFVVWMRLKSEIKERTAPSGGGILLQNQTRHRARFQAEYRLGPAAEMHSRVEWTFFRVDNQAFTKGFLAFQEFTLRRPGWPVSGTARFVLFDTDDSDTRIYTYERDVFSALSVPSFAGRGSRFYLNLTWRASKWLTIESRFGQTVLEKTVSESSGPGRKTEWKVQARMRF